MRLIDADALITEINDRIDAAIKWGCNAIADGDKEIKLRAEQAVATFCEASLTAKKMPTIDPAKWIPVSERLPKEGVQVLVTDDAGGLATIDVDCGYFDKEYGRFEWFHSQNVTAWMPLPEPYAERREGNG